MLGLAVKSVEIFMKLVHLKATLWTVSHDFLIVASVLLLSALFNIVCFNNEAGSSPDGKLYHILHHGVSNVNVKAIRCVANHLLLRR